MARECLQMAVEEKDALVAAGWIFHGGPYSTQEECLSSCTSDSQPTTCCPDANLPGTIYLRITFSDCECLEGDFVLTWDPTINSAYNISPGAWISPYSSDHECYNGANMMRWRLYCSGLPVVSPNTFVLEHDCRNASGTVTGGASHEGVVIITDYVCSPFSATGTSEISGTWDGTGIDTCCYRGNPSSPDTISFNYVLTE